MNDFTFVVSTVLAFVLGLIVYLLFRKHSLHQDLFEQKREYEEEIEQKAEEVSRVVEELRATQLKLMESGKVSALASLSAGILHQISQPITAIHGFAKFLKREMDSSEEFYRPICLIEEQASYLKTMLGDLMELVRHREITKENVQVNDIIMRAMNLLKDELRIQRIGWELDLEEELPPVFADGTHLQQIFMNVVTNAIQALNTLPKGAEKHLKISSRLTTDDNQIEISFKDSGPGIKVLDKMRVFEPFFSTKANGAGIGLSLCQDLIAEHGGTINVESEPDKGANFIIRLPCAPKESKLSA